jgi:hypothetical protein
MKLIDEHTGKTLFDGAIGERLAHFVATACTRRMRVEIFVVDGKVTHIAECIGEPLPPPSPSS